jgi:molybdopterin biosynthesis enzyme
MVITGNEVYHGLIEDRFAPILSEKVRALGSKVDGITFAPDDENKISAAIRSHIDRGCDLMMLSGGMSVDPDDVTRKGIRLAGATEMHYGAAVLPGAMFLVAYIEDIPLLGVPACGLGSGLAALTSRGTDRQSGTGFSRPWRAVQGLRGVCVSALPLRQIKAATKPHLELE